MQAALDAVAIVASLVAVIFDERWRRIPNWLSYGTALLGLMLRAGWALAQLSDARLPLVAALVPAAVGGITLGLVFGTLSIVGLLGFGDSKLLFGLGICVGHPLSLQLALCVLLSGGVIALVQMFWRRSGTAVLGNLARARALAREDVAVSLRRERGREHAPEGERGREGEREGERGTEPPRARVTGTHAKAAPRKHLVGYALAIAVGTLWAILGRRLPWLLPL